MIQLRGPHTLRGICRRSRDELFTPDGYYPTGDLGHLDDDGFMFYHGRSDDMFKVSGATVYPGEVEQALRTIDGVENAFVTEVSGAVGAVVVKAGVGYLLKQRVADVATFLADLERVHAGGTVLDPEVVALMVTRARRRHSARRGLMNARARSPGSSLCASTTVWCRCASPRRTSRCVPAPWTSTSALSAPIRLDPPKASRFVRFSRSTA